jgi:hypothetical protein
MKIRIFILSLVCFGNIRAETLSPIALTGQVGAADEGEMEGVLVSARKAGSTITITVVSDEQGIADRDVQCEGFPWVRAFGYPNN